MRYTGNDKPHIGDILNLLPIEEKEHMRRVGAFTGLLSEKAYRLGVYSGASCWDGREHFGRSAEYHDIGKAWIPRCLLMKRGSLSRQEELILKLHPVYAEILAGEIAGDLLRGLPERVLLSTLQSAAYHHERWDGRGYPHGARGPEIPLVARITAVCDAYDAMTSERPYKAALSHDFACREIQASTGTQFDPLLSAVFLLDHAAFRQMSIGLKLQIWDKPPIS